MNIISFKSLSHWSRTTKVPVNLFSTFLILRRSVSMQFELTILFYTFRALTRRVYVSCLFDRRVQVGSIIFSIVRVVDWK